MGLKTFTVHRFNPDTGELGAVEYRVPGTVGSVLDALTYLRQHVDGDLQFRCSCVAVRDTRCGLCAVIINGKPRLACRTPLRNGMEVAPLRQPGPLRDLVVDHGYALRRLRDLGLCASAPPQAWPARVVQPPGRRQLMGCTDCLGCLSTCPTYSTGGSFGGPYEFVKLAQLWLNDRDTGDRLAQANSLGIERCDGCRACYCVSGVPIVKQAILPMLKAARERAPV